MTAPRAASGCHFAVDAGGSRTRVLVETPTGRRHEVELPSINRHATGGGADRALHEMFVAVRDLTADRPATGWLASASVDPDSAGPHADRELDRLCAAAARAGLTATLVVSNDVVPLLWGVPALCGVGVVAVCGTGTGFLGADGAGGVARASGCEYLGGDEGGAADIGLAGLRAAVRGADGRGPATTLPFDAALARRIAAEPFPKQRLAELAPAVCAAWRAGDAVAGAIVDGAVTELVTGVRAVRDRLDLPDRFAVAAAGGVLTANRDLYRTLAGRLRAELGATAWLVDDDTAAVVLAGLPRFAAQGFPRARVLTTGRRRHVAGTVPGGVR